MSGFDSPLSHGPGSLPGCPPRAPAWSRIDSGDLVTHSSFVSSPPPVCPSWAILRGRNHAAYIVSSAHLAPRTTRAAHNFCTGYKPLPHLHFRRIQPCPTTSRRGARQPRPAIPNHWKPPTLRLYPDRQRLETLRTLLRPRPLPQRCPTSRPARGIGSTRSAAEGTTVRLRSRVALRSRPKPTSPSQRPGIHPKRCSRPLWRGRTRRRPLRPLQVRWRPSIPAARRRGAAPASLRRLPPDRHPVARSKPWISADHRRNGSDLRVCWSHVPNIDGLAHVGNDDPADRAAGPSRPAPGSRDLSPSPTGMC